MCNENIVPMIALMICVAAAGFIVRASFEQWVISDLKKKLASYEGNSNGDKNTPDPLPVQKVEGDNLSS